MPQNAAIEVQSLLKYKIVGSRVALGVLNRLAPPDADRTGALSPIAEITLPDSVKAVAGIPMKAKHSGRHSMAQPWAADCSASLLA